MAKKKTRTLRYPLGGQNRRLGFQSQPPYTTYDSENTVPDSQDLGRARGGSRPGLVRLYKTSASTAIQAIATVNVKESAEAFNFWSDTFEFDAFSSTWTTSDNVIGGVTSTAPSVSGGQFYGDKGDAVEQKVIYRAAPTDQETLATNDTYMLGMYVIPYNNAHHGQYSIYFRLDASPSVTADSTAMEARMSITGTGTVSVQLYKQNVALGSAYTATDSVTTEGWFEVKVTKGAANDTIEIFWRGESLGSTAGSTGTTTDKNFGFGLKATVASGRVIVDRVRLQYGTSAAYELLRPRTVFIQGGQVFRETTYFQKFAASSSNLRCNSSAELCVAERGGKLYIADWGTPVANGTNGSITGGNTFDSASYSDWTTVLSGSTGTDTYFGNFVVHVLGFTTVASANDGVIAAASDGSGYTFDSATYANWTTYLSSTPTAENYYGKYRIQITSAGVNYGYWEISAAAAASLTLVGTPTPGSGLTFSLVRETTRGAFPITALAAGSLTISGDVPTSDSNLSFRIERGPKVYDLTNDTLTLWTATSGRGMVPVGCRSIARYRDRLVLAVDPLDPNEYYMSRLGDPNDWLFTDVDAGAALKGSNADAGKMGDAVTALMPYSDDHLFFGCRGSLWIMRGDPAGGGRADLVSATIGVVGLHSWCNGPKGEVIWLSRDGVYVTNPECLTCEPVSLSREKMPRELLDADPNRVTASMGYDVRNRAVLLFITPTDVTSGVRHWWYDWSNKGFFPIKFAATGSYPTCCTYISAPDPEDSCLLLGCAGGSIRRFSWTAANDDAAAIASYVLIGPIALGGTGYHDGMIQELSTVTGTDSGNVTWGIYVGDTAEAAARATSAFTTGTWDSAGQNSIYPMARGGAYVLKITGTAGYRWSFEEATAVERELGKQRV